MKKIFCLCFYLLPLLLFAQQTEQAPDSLSKPIIPIKKPDPVKDVNVFLDMRFGFLNHFENGREGEDYTEFRNSQVAIGIYGKVHEKVSFRFRNRYNRETSIQTLDMLGGSVEMAFIDIELSPKSNLQLGKMFAFFGGYEYEFNPIEVMEYNDIQNNLLSYVTGVAYRYKISPKHSLGFQALNSRTMTFEDLFEGHVSENVKEPKWPLALVLNWEGSFWEKKFETKYSFSRFRMAKGKGTTTAITLGNKFQTGKFKLMYDFNYDYEQLDTKGIVTEILDGETIANDVNYIEHWIRAEYRFSPKITGLLTLMTSEAFGKDIHPDYNSRTKLRRSYGIIPTIYYQPFKDLDLRIYAAYIGRSYQYTTFPREYLGITNYTANEFRLGFIAPLWIL